MQSVDRVTDGRNACFRFLRLCSIALCFNQTPVKSFTDVTLSNELLSTCFGDELATIISPSPLRWSLNVLSTARGRQNAFLLHFQDVCISEYLQ